MRFHSHWGLSESAQAGEFFGIPSMPGPFEMDPKDAVVIGDVNDPKVVKARKKVSELVSCASIGFSITNMYLSS